jgi:hypothetical protein
VTLPSVETPPTGPISGSRPGQRLFQVLRLDTRCPIPSAAASRATPTRSRRCQDAAGSVGLWGLTDEVARFGIVPMFLEVMSLGAAPAQLVRGALLVSSLGSGGCRLSG